MNLKQRRLRRILEEDVLFQNLSDDLRAAHARLETEVVNRQKERLVLVQRIRELHSENDDLRDRLDLVRGTAVDLIRNDHPRQAYPSE